jgi:hypothetical protein
MQCISYVFEVGLMTCSERTNLQKKSKSGDTATAESSSSIQACITLIASHVRDASSLKEYVDLCQTLASVAMKDLKD